MSHRRSITGLRPPKQERSRRSLQRIVASGRIHFAKSDPRDVSLREIAENAGVSMSSLFARFPSKDSLLDYIHAAYCEERTANAERVVARLQESQLDPEAIAESAIRSLLDWSSTHGQLERSLLQVAAQHDGIRHREARSQRRRLKLLRSFVTQIVDEPSGDANIEAAIQLVLAAAPEFERQLAEAKEDPRREDIDALASKLARVLLPSFGVPPKSTAAVEESRSSPQRQNITTENLLAAARPVIDGRPLLEISESELSAAAGVSIAEFHDHFENRKALLHGLLDQLTQSVVESVDPLADPERWEGRSLSELVGEVTERYSRFWEDFGGLIKTIRIAEENDSELAQRRSLLDREVEDRIVQVIAQLAPELVAPDREADTRRRVHTLAAGIRAFQDRPELFDLSEASDHQQWLADFLEMAKRTVSAPRAQT